MTESLDERIAKAEAAERAARERTRALKAKRKAAERKARTHALCVYGAMVERALGGDWRAIDPRALDAWLAARAGDAQRAARLAEPRAAADARADLHAYQGERRAAAKAAAGAAAAAQSASRIDEIMDW